MTSAFCSWGRYPRARHRVYSLDWRHDPLPAPEPSISLLPYGLGRSYGDSCLNDQNALLRTRGLDRWIYFDSLSGILRCEAGISLAEILAMAVPRGWFLPVTPGTKFVTLGGAIANDVHGKNHHAAGTFGHFVRAFELVRSDRPPMLCSPESHPEWFRATIGGLGLTGLITWAEIQLRQIPHSWIHLTSIKFREVDEFLELSRQLEPKYEYLVGWVDCFSPKDQLGRGLLLCGSHGTDDERVPRPPEASPARLRIPLDFPSFALNKWALKAFNALFYHRQRPRMRSTLVHYDPYFYPLDAILEWNRIYGKRGLLQWQGVLPLLGDSGPIRSVLETIRQSGYGSFLAVIKTMGTRPSPGLMSFSRPGITLALDFPAHPDVFPLLEKLDQVVAETGGVLYPAKDARMSARHFQLFYPQWEEFTGYVDPRFSSSFWRRVTRAG